MGKKKETAAEPKTQTTWPYQLTVWSKDPVHLDSTKLVTWSVLAPQETIDAILNPTPPQLVRFLTGDGENLIVPTSLIVRLEGDH